MTNGMWKKTRIYLHSCVTSDICDSRMLSIILWFYILETSESISELVPICATHGNFIVLPLWETRPPAPWLNIPHTLFLRKPLTALA